MRKIGAIVCILIIAIGVSAFTHGVNAPTVNAYFSSSTGSDSNPCTMASPCATFTKANSLQYGPNSTINLLAGDTFTTGVGLSLIGPGDNSKTQNVFGPLTIQSYGGGTCNVIAGTIGGCATIKAAGPLTIGILMQDVPNATVQNLRVIADATFLAVYEATVGIEYNAHTSTDYNLTVENVEVEDFNILIYLRAFAGILSGVTIEDNLLHGVSNTDAVDAGLLVQGFVNNGLVQGNLVYNLGGAASGHGGATANPILISDGASVWTDQFNVTHDFGVNSATCGGPYGNWTFEVTTVVVQFNESYNGGKTTSIGSACDYGGFDLDGGTSFSTWQYNYAHNNDGAEYNMFMAPEGGYPWKNNTVRYNIGEEIKGTRSQVGGMFEMSGATNLTSTTYAYNNTFATDWDVHNATGTVFGNCSYWVYDANVMLANNICYNAGATGVAYMTQSGFSSFTHPIMINNSFYRVNRNNSGGSGQQGYVWGSQYATLAALQNATGFESGSVIVNPMISSPLAGSTCYTSGTPAGPQPCPSGYVLSGGSPMIGAGLNLTKAFGLKVGILDYYGNTVPNGVGTGYNIGADGGNP